MKTLCRNGTTPETDPQLFSSDYMNYMSDSACPLCVMSFTNDVADKTKAMLEQINRQAVVLQKLAIVRAQLVKLHTALRNRVRNITARGSGII